MTIPYAEARTDTPEPPSLAIISFKFYSYSNFPFALLLSLLAFLGAMFITKCTVENAQKKKNTHQK